MAKQQRFALGDRVRFTHNVVKARVSHGVTWKVVGVPVRFVDYMDENKQWQREDRPLTEGVIVGARTLSDYSLDYYGEGLEYERIISCVPGTGRKAWLVSYDLRRKPVLVLDEHVKAVEPTPTQ